MMMRERASWVELIERTREARHMTRADLCHQVQSGNEDARFSERTLERCYKGARQLQGDEARRIADILEIDPRALFEALGWLGVREGAAALDAHTAARVTLRLLLSSGNLGGPEGLVRQAVATGRWDVHLRSPFRGTGDGRKRQNHYVGLCHVDRDFPSSAPGLASSELIREIERDFGSSLHMAPALPEQSEDVCAELTRTAWPQAQGWYLVPAMTALRLPRSPVEHTKFETIVVVGTHGAGADNIAAHLADELGWGYANTSFVAQQIYSRRLDPVHQRAHDHRCAELAAAFVQTGLGRNMVIGHGNPGTAGKVARLVFEQERRAVAEAIASDDGRTRRGSLVVWADAGPNLVAFGTRFWSDRPDPVNDAAYRRIETQGDAVQREANATKELRNSFRRIRVELPAGVLAPAGQPQPDAVDAIYDASYAAVFGDLLEFVEKSNRGTTRRAPRPRP